LATALAVDGAAADDMALRALGESIPRRAQMLTDSVRFSRGPATVTQEGDAVVISFPNTASSVVVLDVDPAAVRAAIRGMTPEEAVATLQRTWRLQGTPELTLGPEWIEPLLRLAAAASGRPCAVAALPHPRARAVCRRQRRHC
jgi:hypothetical protein